MNGSLLRYWPVAIVVFFGAAFTTWLGLRSESWTVVGWSGATIGILAGIAIGALGKSGPGSGPR